MSDAFSAAALRAVEREAKVIGIIESAKEPASEAASGLLGNAAQRRGVPFFLMASKGERPQSFLERLQPDLICVAAMAQLLRPVEFTLPRLGAINLHPSLLPKYRGPKPYLWQSLAMDLQGGVTVHRIDQGIDTGDILHQRGFPIPLGTTYNRLRQRYFRATAAAFTHALRLLHSGQAAWRSQGQSAELSYARRPAAGEKLLDWDWPIERLWHFLRSAADEYFPFPPARGMRGWKVGRIDRRATSKEPGTLATDGDGTYVAHREGRIRMYPLRPRGFWEEKLYWWTRRFRQKWEWR